MMANQRKFWYKFKPCCRYCNRPLSANSSRDSKNQMCGVCVHEKFPGRVKRGIELMRMSRGGPRA